MRTKTKVCKILILKNGLKIERTDNGRRRTLHAHGDKYVEKRLKRRERGSVYLLVKRREGIVWGRERLLELERLFEEIRWSEVGGLASVFSPGTNGHFKATLGPGSMLC